MDDEDSTTNTFSDVTREGSSQILLTNTEFEDCIKKRQAAILAHELCARALRDIKDEEDFEPPKHKNVVTPSKLVRNDSYYKMKKTREPKDTRKSVLTH